MINNRSLNMTLYEFRQLTDEQQYKLITKNAVQISGYKKGAYQFCLFQVFSFYVESRYNTGTPDTALLRTLTPDEIPEYHLSQIDLGGLLNLL